MPKDTNDKDVNTDADDAAVDDNVTADHNAGLGSSADDLETHNPDAADFDKAIADIAAAKDDDDAADASGGTVKTDDAADSDGADSDTDDDDDKDEPKIPRSRLNEVIKKGEDAEKVHREKELEWTRKEAVFEGRLAALEKPPEAKVDTADPLDDILKGEPQAILDAFQENPADFVRMIQSQAKSQGLIEAQAQREEERYQAGLSTALNEFAEKRDDFMSNAQKLVDVMDSNPIHNVISAYAYEIEIPALTAKLEAANQDVDDRIATAKTEGIAEGRKEAIKEIQAKGAASVLDGSQANAGQNATKATGLDTGGDGTVLRDKLTADLLASRAVKG